MENGWEFHDTQGNRSDAINGKSYLYEIYLMANSKYEGRVTVPMLWDKKNMIVNNESFEIIRILNSEFFEFTDNDYDFYLAELRK